MNENDCNNFQDQFLNRNAVLSVSPKSSNPIPILSSNNMGKRPSVEEMESCEEYTCVISHFGDNQIKKREYFDDGVCFETKNYVKITSNSSPPLVSDDQTEEFQMADFLSSCFRCKKQLHGLDIFMYRGEKAFCSAECRCKQLARDERKEKRVSRGRKAQEYFRFTMLRHNALFCWYSRRIVTKLSEFPTGTMIPIMKFQKC